jgi:hypothetical protein
LRDTRPASRKTAKSCIATALLSCVLLTADRSAFAADDGFWRGGGLMTTRGNGRRCRERDNRSTDRELQVAEGISERGSNAMASRPV